jgi:hypothetical protein
VDSGKKVWLARFLYALVPPSPELPIWLGDWAVWPSSQHMPLFTRFREAFGEKRPWIDAPGHLLKPEEANDAISIISVALLFFWDCHLIPDATRSLRHTMNTVGSPAGIRESPRQLAKSLPTLAWTFGSRIRFERAHSGPAGGIVCPAEFD